MGEDDGMSELVECPQCGRRTRTSRMVAAPDHAGHEAECDTCEADRQAVRELFTPLTWESLPAGQP